MCCGGKIGVAGVTQLDCVEWGARVLFQLSRTLAPPFHVLNLSPRVNNGKVESIKIYSGTDFLEVQRLL